MANQNLVTSGFKVNRVELDYYSPVATLNNQVITNMYAFLARVDPWADDTNPVIPTQDQQYIKSVFKNIFVVKKIQTSQISPVIQRFDWISGLTYDFYQDNIDMFEVDQNGFLILQFYVKNRYDQVFKCLWNNNGSPSTFEPFFQPGSYGTNNIFVGADGYKWKYMYTIDIGSKRNFMDATWMPVPVGANTPNPYLTNAGYGDVEVINVTNGGSGYDAVNSFIQVTVSGDGSGASGNVVVSGGSITNIVVGTAGQNYTYANVSITAYTSSNLAQISTFGTGVNAIAPVSPVGGHGFDPISELGCNRVMYTMEFNGSEGGYIPTNIEYRQVGLLANPSAISTYPNPATGSIYKTTTDFVLASGFGAYISDETITQQTANGQVYFTGTVLSFNPGTNVLNVINTQGTPNINGTVFGSTSATGRTLLSVSNPDFISMSGYLAYIENRSGIQRSADGIEALRFVLAY